MTSNQTERIAAAVRVGLGFLFVMTGVMKLVVPVLREAFIGQLAASGLPLQQVSQWMVPLAELVVGVMLLLGLYTRLSLLAVLGLMSVATYVHIVAEDPALFPLQPSAPVIPLLVILLAAGLLLRAGVAGREE